MNRFWVFMGGCVTGVLGVLAAAAVADEGARVAMNAGKKGGDASAEEGQEQDEEGEAVGVVE